MIDLIGYWAMVSIQIFLLVIPIISVFIIVGMSIVSDIVQDETIEDNVFEKMVRRTNNGTTVYFGVVEVIDGIVNSIAFAGLVLWIIYTLIAFTPMQVTYIGIVMTVAGPPASFVGWVVLIICGYLLSRTVLRELYKSSVNINNLVEKKESK